ncbi:MAG: FtsL-like putative cell division protein [Bacteroidota bacterium]
MAGDFLTRESLMRQASFFFFLVGLFILQISIIYYFESVQIDIKKTKEQLNDLNSEYSTNASELSVLSQHSEVMEVMKELGIINSENTPNIIDVDSTFFKEVVRE